ncbi:MAG: outer membrane lipoprotein carrier protein LolA [Flavobacteriales bacterium]|nr:outer membrane lipoprotein carrier protein LolA [Flavobacteriales bacterium]
MKKYRLLSAALILFVSTGTIKAQDAKAKSILDKLSAKTQTYTSMKAEFEYVMKNEAEDLEENQSGSILTKGEKYHLEIAGQKIISDGKTVWTVLDEAEEVQVNTVPEEDDSEDFISPTKILTLWEKGFKYKYSNSSTLNGAAVDVINLYPEDADNKSFHTIKLYVNRAKLVVDQIEIKGKDGTDFIYKITSFQTNESIDENNFTFSTSQHPSYDVIDLR